MEDPCRKVSCNVNNKILLDLPPAKDYWVLVTAVGKRVRTCSSVQGTLSSGLVVRVGHRKVAIDDLWYGYSWMNG